VLSTFQGRDKSSSKTFYKKLQSPKALQFSDCRKRRKTQIKVNEENKKQSVFQNSFLLAARINITIFLKKTHITKHRIVKNVHIFGRKICAAPAANRMPLLIHGYTPLILSDYLLTTLPNYLHLAIRILDFLVRSRQISPCCMKCIHVLALVTISLLIHHMLSYIGSPILFRHTLVLKKLLDYR